MGYEVHQSHCLEDLLAVLAEHLASDPLPPLATETILVPTPGLARWLQLQLARRSGIAAGIRMPFVGAFLQELQRAASPEADPFARDVLVFRLWRLLGDPTQREQLGAAAAYCADDPTDEKRFQLCTSLAACLDDYQLYRDDLLLRFAGGDDGDELGPHGPWQAKLWRALLRDAGIETTARPRSGRRPSGGGPLLFPELAAAPPPKTSAPHRLERLRELLRDPRRARQLLPPRLSVFGTATLPPAVVRLLQSIAAHVPVRLYVPAPTPHFFGDQRPRDHDGGNPLLARWGTEAREFADLLTDLEGAASDGPPLERHDLGSDDEGPPHTLLQCLQRDIRDVADRGSRGGPPRFALRLDDESLRIHDCHSPQRELEVVRDRVLAAFDADDSLQPHDVLVLVPDIERYAPYAHAVFGPVRDHLPFRVADRSAAADLAICASLLSVLDLARGRLQAFDVLHLLEEPALRRRFGLTAAELPALRALCDRAGIRWGLDGQSRADRFGVPAFDDNAWLPGFDRLLLGTATGPLDGLVAGLLPVADVTESRSDLLARFVHFARTLFERLTPLQRRQTLGGWADLIDGLAADFYRPEGADDEAAMAQLRRATSTLRGVVAAARHTEPVDLVVLRDWLLGALQHGAGARGFLAGSVTVAAMLPMRTVPVRHLFVCGLDDASFPRRDQPPPFDLMHAERRAGDRSRRLDDRQVFLDVLLAARERLHLCFVGHSAKDDAPVAPSVMLAELCEHIDRSCVPPPERRRPRDSVIVQHPLQTWSRRYRSGADERLFTFARRKEAPVAAMQAEPPWSETPPPASPVDTTEEIPLERLLEFWNKPCRFYLGHTLGLRLPRDEGDDGDTEPFAVNGLDRFHLQDTAVRRALRGEEPVEDALALARASGVLPVGAHGEVAFADLSAETESFLALAKQHHATGRRSVQARGRDFVIRGELEGVGDGEFVQLYVAKDKPKYRMRTWVLHVVAAVARHQGAPNLPQRARLIAKDAHAVAGPLGAEEADEHLDRLVSWFRRGQQAPLTFFEESWYTYVEELDGGKDAHQAMRLARGKWEPRTDRDRGRPNDQEDASMALCMRGRDPLAEPLFAELAEEIWRPVFEHLGPA